MGERSMTGSGEEMETSSATGLECVSTGTETQAVRSVRSVMGVMNRMGRREKVSHLRGSGRVSADLYVTEWANDDDDNGDGGYEGLRAANRRRNEGRGDGRKSWKEEGKSDLQLGERR